MSRENRRRRPATEATDADTIGAGQPQLPPPPRRGLMRREAERVENAPGYASPAPWSVRGVLVLYALMVLVNFPVAVVGWKLDRSISYAESVVAPSVFLYLFYALVAMPWARRLAGEPRSMRPLETISTAALSYLIYYVAARGVVGLVPGGVDAHNLGAVVGVGLAGLAGGAVGAALYPMVYRRFWMPRLPRSRRP